MKINLKISKLDAVKRQLETAIKLYFMSEDPVSIHTLTAAAYNVIRDINRQRGGKPLIVKDQLPEHIKPEYVKDFRNKLNEAENFLKHADRDHDNSLDFYPDQSELLMFDACLAYWKLTGEEPPLFKLYRYWYMANNQDFFILSEEYANLLARAAEMDIVKMGREVYFNTILPLLTGIRK